MSMMPVDAALSNFAPDDYTVRLVQGIFKVVPYAPAMPAYRNLDDAVRALDANAPPVAFAKAKAMAMHQDVQDVLWMSRLLDTGDKGYALFTGLKSAFNLVRGAENALETDTQQRNDAVLKAVGLAYMAYNAFPGSITERAEAFRTTPAGQALTMYYAAVEIALPFADNAAIAGGNFMDQLINRDGSAQASRLAAMAPGKSLEGAMEMLKSISGGIQRVVDHASKYTKPIASSAQQYLPAGSTVATGADRAAGVVAGAADVMPVYTFLGGRLAAEGAAWRALKS